MVVRYIKKIRHSLLCVTGVYLRDLTDTLFEKFALECELSEHLLFLFDPVCCPPSPPL